MIRIPGTPVDYPVMWTPDEPEKYLRADFDGNYSLSGLPLVSADCNVNPLPDDKAYSNTLIYGHHMQDGSMFAVLTEYENQDFYEKHRTICFDRIYADGCYKEYEYEVIGAFKTEIHTGNSHEFRYYDYTDVSNKKAFDEYMASMEERNLILAGYNGKTQTNLLTLFTCSYHVAGENGRFVVVAVLLK